MKKRIEKILAEMTEIDFRMMVVLALLCNFVVSCSIGCGLDSLKNEVRYGRH
jgi:hypothetical protein